jgi:hypothetical protein
MGNPCVATAPEAVWVKPATAHGADCATKAWKIGKCVANQLVYSYESDVANAPSGTVLAGNWVSAIPPQKVEVCGNGAPVALAPNGMAVGKDCVGADLPAVPTHAAVLAIPHPTAVQLVKICGDKPKFDREMVVLCAPDGTRVIVQNVTPEDSPLGASPVFEAYTLAGAPYTGSITTLTDCATEKVDLADAEDYCLNGVNYSRVDGIDIKTGLPVFSTWLNDAGIPVAAPVGAKKGICEECKPTICCPRDAFYADGGVLSLTPVQEAWVFPSYPTLNADFSNLIDTSNFYLHAIEHAATQVWGTNGLPFVNPTIPVLWANAQPAIDAFISAVGLPAGCLISATDGSGQPVVVYDNTVIHSSDIAWWCGHEFPDQYVNKLRQGVQYTGAVVTDSGSCRMIKLVDTIACDGSITTKAFEVNNLPIAGFYPSKLVETCNTCQKYTSGLLSAWSV